MSKPMVLNLDSEAFNAFKSDFNMILRNTLATMQQKEVEDASITVKFDISLLQRVNPNVDAPDSPGERDITSPTFKHKVAASMKIKSEKGGYVGGPDYELVWDKTKSDYVMKPIKDNQTSIFDDDYRYDPEPEADEDE